MLLGLFRLGNKFLKHLRKNTDFPQQVSAIAERQDEFRRLYHTT